MAPLQIQVPTDLLTPKHYTTTRVPRRTPGASSYTLTRLSLSHYTSTTLD